MLSIESMPSSSKVLSGLTFSKGIRGGDDLRTYWSALSKHRGFCVRSTAPKAFLRGEGVNCFSNVKPAAKYWQ